MDDRHHEIDPEWSGRYEAPVGRVGRRTSILPWLAVIGVALVVAIAKPWGMSPGGPSPSAVAGGTSPRTDATDPAADPAADPDLVGVCHNTDAWLLATVELSRGQAVRILRVLDPSPGPVLAGQDVPRLVFGSEQVTGLGWCAPVVGSARSSGIASVTAWAIRDGRARTVPLVGDRAFVDSGYGSLYRPPTPGLGDPRGGAGPMVSTPGTWSSGVYVFTLTDVAGSQRSFAIDLEILPAQGPRASPAPIAPTPVRPSPPRETAAPRPPQDRGQATR